MTALTLSNVNKSFGNVHVLKDITLEVEEGEFVVFVGPSGCGKSTLLRVIAGLEDASSGEINIGGQQVNLVPPSKRGIAMVFQSYALYPPMNVYDNIIILASRKVMAASKTMMKIETMKKGMNARRWTETELHMFAEVLADSENSFAVALERLALKKIVK